MIFDDALRFEQAYLLWWLLPALVGAIVWRIWVRKQVVYRYSLARYLAQKTGNTILYFRVILFILRFSILVLLAFLIAKPQVPDKRTRMSVEGIDIVLALDASGSMACFDDMQDRRSRMQVAKEEAIRFVQCRATDAIGVVVFGNGVISACPLTHDKTVLTEILEHLEIGSMVDDRSTLLAHGLMAALNRLKPSRSPSKIIIMLTDGQPSMHDLSPSVPVSIAQQLGVKIYTIGIGNERGGFVAGPHGMILAEGVQLNEQLLEQISKQTGGVFYRARNAQEIRSIYDTIDKLEKQSVDVPLYTHYRDIFEPFLWLIIILVTLELCLNAFVWRHL